MRGNVAERRSEELHTCKHHVEHGRDLRQNQQLGQYADEHDIAAHHDIVVQALRLLRHLCAEEHTEDFTDVVGTSPAEELRCICEWVLRVVVKTRISCSQEA